MNCVNCGIPKSPPTYYPLITKAGSKAQVTALGSSELCFVCDSLEQTLVTRPYFFELHREWQKDQQNKRRILEGGKSES